jgi:hypothetical protein
MAEYRQLVQLALSTPSQQPNLHLAQVHEDGTDIPQFLFPFEMTLPYTYTDSTKL